MTNEASVEIDVVENQNADVEHGNIGKNLENDDDDDDHTKSIKFRFMESLHILTPTTKVNIKERERLIKIKKEISYSEFIRANIILEKFLHGDDSFSPSA